MLGPPGPEELGSGRGVGERRALTVSELTLHIKRVLGADPLLGSLMVRGEISNYRQPSSGHMYFTLKDDGAAIRCVMFRRQNYSLRFRPENGMSVDALGYVGLYERDGQYQLYVQEMRPSGVGDLHLAFEQLKARLSAEGLFDAAIKRRPPALPRRVAIVTSPTGAAVRDVLKVAERRWPGLQAVVVPVPVQGRGAAEKIARGLATAGGLPGVDVVVLVRGGGSLEELWAFNEEPVARAIRACPAPVVAGVGHETDVTIADLAADLRAPTPSAAAELVFPDRAALVGQVGGLAFRLRAGLRKRAAGMRRRLDRALASRVFSRPGQVLAGRAQHLDLLRNRLAGATRLGVERQRRRVAALAGKLEVMSPLAVLARGYALCTERRTGRLISQAGQVAAGERVTVRLSRGGLECRVERTTDEGGGGAERGES